MKTLLFLLAGCVVSLFASEQNVRSRVVEVTVFNDRALVLREAFIDLKKGQHTLVFSDITTDIKDESVRINVPGFNAKILDVKIERRFTTESRREKLQEINDKIDLLRQQDKIAFDKISVLESKKEFVESLKAESGRYYSQTMLLKPNAVSQWNASLQFVEKNLTEIFADLRNLLIERDRIAQEIRVLEFEKEQFSFDNRQDYKEIIVKIEALNNGRIELQPTYIVNNAGWYPMYDTRVDTKEKIAELSYYAMVHQATGEDWQDIQMTLSTADPVSVTELPRLEPWVLDTYRRQQKRQIKKPLATSGANFSIDYDQNRGLAAGKGSVSGYVLDMETGEPLVGANVIFEGTNIGASTDLSGRFSIPAVDKGSKKLQVSYVGYRDVNFNMIVREKYNAELIIEMQAEHIESDAIVVTAEKPLIRASISQSNVITVPPRLEFSDAYAKALSTVFALKTKNTIPSDNNVHKVTVFIENLTIDFNYLAIPKINPGVFLKGKMTNTTGYPLLEGELNVFVDNDFVNRTYLGIIPPTDTLELALGIDDNIQIEKNLLKRYVESKGLLSGSKRVTYDLEIRIKNNRLTAEHIELKDQIPSAANEKIKTELVTPSSKEKILNKNNELTWQINLKAGEEKVIPIQYYVEFPADLPVYGLE